jgi:hypothetical protein
MSSNLNSLNQVFAADIAAKVDYEVSLLEGDYMTVQATCNEQRPQDASNDAVTAALRSMRRIIASTKHLPALALSTHWQTRIHNAITWMEKRMDHLSNTIRRFEREDAEIREIAARHIGGAEYYTTVKLVEAMAATIKGLEAERLAATAPQTDEPAPRPQEFRESLMFPDSPYLFAYRTEDTVYTSALRMADRFFIDNPKAEHVYVEVAGTNRVYGFTPVRAVTEGEERFAVYDSSRKI